MTILEAIKTAVENLEGVRLPIRDTDNINRVRTALILLDALKDSVKTQETNTNEEGPDHGTDD